MIRFVSKYLEKTESYSTVRFIFEMFLITFFSKILLSLIIILFVDFINVDESLFIGEFETRAESLIGEMHWVFGFVLLCIVVPFFESLIGQVIPISLIAYFSKSKAIIVITIIHGLYNFIPFLMVYLFPA